MASATRTRGLRGEPSRIRNASRFSKAFEPFDFAWTVTARGYGWITTRSLTQPDAPLPPNRDAGADEKGFYELAVAQSQARRWLTDGVPNDHAKRAFRYAPLLDTALFRDFAATPTTEEAIAAFANRWGSLLGRQAPLIHLEGPSGEAMLAHGEELEFWVDEILRMGEAIEFWERTRRADRAWLARFIHWRSCGDVVMEGSIYEGYLRFALIADPKLSPEVLKCFTQGDVLTPARYHLQRVVNDHLELYASPLLLWDRDQLRPRIVPENLLGCLWLQLSRAIDGNREYRQCPICQGWFELGRGTRSDKLYCSGACKQVAYRERPELSPGST
jgi:hypothetical protein